MWYTRLIAHHNKILRPSDRDPGMLPGFVPMRFDHSIMLNSAGPGNDVGGMWGSRHYVPSFLVESFDSGGQTANDIASWRFLDGGHSKFSIAFWIRNEGEELLLSQHIGFHPGWDSSGRYAKKQVIVDGLGDVEESHNGFEIYFEGNGSYTDPYGNTVDGINNKVTFKVGSTTVSTNPSTVDFCNNPLVAEDNNVWKHIVCTYDSSLGSNNMKIYANGYLHAQADCTTVLNIDNDMPRIGRNNLASTSNAMTLASTSYSSDVTTVTGTKGCFGNMDNDTIGSNYQVTISGTSNNNGTKQLVDNSTRITEFKFHNVGGSSSENESGLSGATATVEHFHPLVNTRIGDMQIWNGAISSLEARVVWLTVAGQQWHVNWNRFRIGDSAIPIISNPRKLFAWYRFGDGIEFRRYGTGSNQAIVHNMSAHTGIGSGRSRDEIARTHLYANVSEAQSDAPETQGYWWPSSQLISPCDSGARRRR